MSQSMLWRLVAKDIRFNRSLALLTLVGGFISIVISGINQAGAIVGLILFVTTMIVYGIFVGQESVTRERRDKTATFILSLPVSTRRYTLAKLLAAAISYISVWAVMLVALMALILISDDTPNGIIPMYSAIMGLMLMNFCILLAVGVATTSSRWITGAVIVTNTLVTLFMVTLFNAPGVESSIGGQSVVWAAEIVWSLVVQAIVIAICIGSMARSQSNKKSFV